MVDRTLKEEIPTVLDYLEGEAPAEGFRFGAPCRSPTSPSPPSSAMPAGCASRSTPRAGRRRPAGSAARWRSPAFAKLATIEDAVLRVPIAEQRDALKALGAPISAETYAGPHRVVA